MRSLLALGAVVAVLLVAACGDNGEEVAGETEVEDVPSKALVAITDPGQIDGFLDFSNGNDKTFGIFVCVDAERVTLESVESMSSEGEIELLGGLFFEADDGFVGAMDGFPPNGLEAGTYSEVAGAVVRLGCDDSDPVQRPQVLVGANRLGPGGGKIEGIRITHDGGALEIADYTILLCGDQYEYCEEYAPEE